MIHPLSGTARIALARLVGPIARSGNMFRKNSQSAPLDTNVLFLTIMATKMPFVGRG